MYGLSARKGYELLHRLEIKGLNDELIERVTDSDWGELSTAIVALIQSDVFKQTASQTQASAIMEENFFGIKEAVTYFGVMPSRAQVLALAQVPYSAEVLNKSRRTHVLVAVFPFYELHWRGRVMIPVFPRVLEDYLPPRDPETLMLNTLQEEREWASSWIKRAERRQGSWMEKDDEWLLATCWEEMQRKEGWLSRESFEMHQQTARNTADSIRTAQELEPWVSNWSAREDVERVRRLWKEMSNVSWHLVSKTPVPDSIGKTWEEQRRRRGKWNEVPSAYVLAYTIVAHYFLTRRRLLPTWELYEETAVHTSSVDLHGRSVNLRYSMNHHGEPHFHMWAGRDRYDFRNNGQPPLGITLARKPDLVREADNWP